MTNFIGVSMGTSSEFSGKEYYGILQEKNVTRKNAYPSDGLAIFVVRRGFY